MFEIPGLELPDNLKRLDSDVIIHKFGEKGNPSGANISYSPSVRGVQAVVQEQPVQKYGRFAKINYHGAKKDGGFDAQTGFDGDRDEG